LYRVTTNDYKNQSQGCVSGLGGIVHIHTPESAPSEETEGGDAVAHLRVAGFYLQQVSTGWNCLCREKEQLRVADRFRHVSRKPCPMKVVTEKPGLHWFMERE